MSQLPVLPSCAKVAAHTQDVFLDAEALAAAAEDVAGFLSTSSVELGSWVKEPLHPLDPRSTTHLGRSHFNFLDWIFFVSTLNFSFWSERSQEDRFGVEWRRGVDGKGGEGRTVHTGYASLLAGVGRAIEEGIPLTTPSYYASVTRAELAHVFRSARSETMPLLDERLAALHQTGNILLEHYGGSFENVVRAARGSATQLVKTIVKQFPAFRDESEFLGEPVYFWKRAQICVAEIWAALEDKEPANFYDIHQLTAFADYRVPQILESIGVLRYSPRLCSDLLDLKYVPHGSEEEVSIRALTLLAVEELRKALREYHAVDLNSLQVDFALWTLAKRRESTAELPHHRTRSIFY